MLARWLHEVVRDKGPEWPLEDVKQLIQSADVAMTNLESVTATQGQHWDKGEGRPYLYRGRPELIDVITSVGFDVVATANNHAMDFGPEALFEQKEILEAVGIADFGTGKNIREASKPTYIRVGNRVLAFIGFATQLPLLGATTEKAGVFYGKDNLRFLKILKGPISQAKRHADLVIVSPHWGKNWTDNPTKDRIKLAHALIDQGVDAILGHSAHHLHGIEIYKGRPIIYDMGTFLFDRVGQKKLRYSAGFVLEFDKGGFKKLNIYPLLLKKSKTTLAEGKAAKKIQSILEESSNKLDPSIRFQQNGNVLSLTLSPEPRAAKPKSEPEVIYSAGRSRPLPKKFHKRKTNVVFKQPPIWTKDFKPIDIGKGLIFLGAWTPDAVWPRRAFRVEVALKVAGPLKGPWRAIVVGKHRDSNEEFQWKHGFADGAWLPHLWRKGQIVVDYTLVRPPKVKKEGIYDLYWGLENIKSKKTLGPNGPSPKENFNMVKIGKIRIAQDKSIPSGPAGVAWDGLVKNNLLLSLVYIGAGLFILISFTLGALKVKKRRALTQKEVSRKGI